MANQLFGFNSSGAPPPGPASSRPLPDSDSSVFSTASRYLLPSSSSQLSAFPPPSSLYNYSATDIAAAGPAAVSTLGPQDFWSAFDATSYQSPALKRSSQVLYHHNILSNTIGQNDWPSMSYLAKRPRIESSSILPIYPQRPGEKDCAHYMLTRTCKFGETCKFDHPIWVPEGGIPDWKEVPPVASECLPERSGEPDCPYFLKTQRCKFGLKCKFNHPKEKLVDLSVKGESGALPERPSEPICAFYLKTGICKFGATCRFHHPKDIQRPVLEQGNVTAELKSFSAKIEGTTGDVKSNVIATPALVHNSKGLPVRPGELDCPFYLKTGSCKYSVTCRYNHPDRIGQALLMSTADNFSNGNPAVSALQSFDQAFLTSMLGSATVVYPQRPGQTECDYYMKTGVCKFGERCKFHHPVDRSAPSTKAQETVKLTPAGYPRREGALTCPYYMKTSTCKYGATCKFDHPPPAEVLAMAAAQASSTATESQEEKGD